MRFRSLIFLFGLSAVGCGSADSLITTPPDGGPGGTVQTGFQARAVVDGGTTYPFQVFIPAAYDKTKKWPVILFLHGSGERGNDNQLQLRTGLGPVVAAQASTFPAIVVFPQMAGGEAVGRIAYVRTAMASLDSVMKEFNGDPARVYLTGLSLGGISGFEIAYRNPTRFAAFAPISATICAGCIFGTPTPTIQQSAQTVAQTLSTLPVWQFQGSLDPNVQTSEVRIIKDIFKSVNPVDQYTEYSGMGHEIWDTVYATTAFYTWLYAQHR